MIHIQSVVPKSLTSDQIRKLPLEAEHQEQQLPSNQLTELVKAKTFLIKNGYPVTSTDGLQPKRL